MPHAERLEARTGRFAACTRHVGPRAGLVEAHDVLAEARTLPLKRCTSLPKARTSETEVRAFHVGACGAAAGVIASHPEAFASPAEVIASPPEVIASPSEVIAAPTEVFRSRSEAIASQPEVIARPRDVNAPPPGAGDASCEAIGAARGAAALRAGAAPSGGELPQAWERWCEITRAAWPRARHARQICTPVSAAVDRAPAPTAARRPQSPNPRPRSPDL